MENNIKINNYIIDKDFITVDDMPNETFRDIVSICGMDTALKLLTKFSGNTILVPVKGFKNIEAKIILKEYDHTTLSIQRLARDLCTSESHIRDVLKANKVDVVQDGQLGLFYKKEQ